MSAGKDLTDKEIGTNIRNTPQQLMTRLGVLVQPALTLLKRLASPTFTHVRHQRPGGTAEPNQGHPSIQSLPGKRDRLKYISQLFLHIDILPETLDVIRCNERIGKDRTARRFHEDFQAESLRDNKDVAEDDGGVEAGVTVNRLESKGRCEGRGLAAFEKGVMFSDLKEFCVYVCKLESIGKETETYQGGIGLPAS